MSIKDAYSKRGRYSIPAPMEEDSDPEFRSGAYIPEEVPKKKRGRGAPAESSTAGTKRKRGSTGRPMKAQKRHKSDDTENALLQYFDAPELDLHSASEDEPDEAEIYESKRSSRKGSQDQDDQDEEEEETEETEDNEYEAEDEEEDEEEDEPVVFRTRPSPPQMTAVKQAPNAAVSKSLISTRAVDDDSEIEPDSEPIVFKKTSTTTNSPMSSQKKDDESLTESDSKTESESDEDIKTDILRKNQQVSPTKMSSLNTPDSEDESSVTEPDSESEEEKTQTSLCPKPGFSLRPGQQLQEAFVLDEEKGIKIPVAINTYLRDYQRDGARFLYRQYKEGRGGLLGDDMGLGKTIQVISFLSAIMKKDGLITDKERRAEHVSRLMDEEDWKLRNVVPKANAKWPTCLIIAPSTVVHNWGREFDTWGYFEVGLYNGSKKEREEVLHSFKLGRLDVLVTSFDLARRDIDLLDDLAWSCVIVDEVHRVKNETSKISLAYHQFACIRRFGLTGTAIQNSYKEMWTILDWTNPGRLGTARQWNGYVVKPLTEGQSAGASEEERLKAQQVALILRDKLLPNFFLRRTKDIIKDQLPKKTDQVVFCPLTRVQIAAYKHLLEMEPLQNLLHRDDPCPCGSKKPRKTCCHPFIPGEVFRYMSVLIKLSNHLALILPGPTDTPEQTMRNRQLAEIAFPDGNIPKYGAAMLLPEYCGKWETLRILLKEWRKDKTNKVLIFTKSVKLLDMLAFHLQTKSYQFLKLDGGTKQPDRMPMIDQFNHDPHIFIFLISTLAGGTGLNLTGANKVVIFDPNWNPAHDLQAMDRAFRFGQARDVSVYRLLGAGSVEELIYARQIYKQQQMAIGYEASVQTRYFEGVQGDSAKQGELFGINNIFKLHEDKYATKMAIEKANLAELDWALANMDGTGKGKKAQKLANELVKADAKVKEDGMDLKGLGALLFDDAPPPTVPTEEDFIKKTLSAIGVTYSHMNDAILVPSKIEAERAKKTLQKARGKRKSKGPPTKKKEKDPSPAEPVWPPVRRHHKVQKPAPEPMMTTEEQLHARRRALIRLGMISCPADVPKFAADFVKQSDDMQRQILAELDAWAAEHLARSQSPDESD
ncbi:hypothetical protein BDN70DRAFT_877317 [Pholiota conissans]|uniref:Uncharacterized protein n=1 Tax=Pholiota conissans TaxID=109636 RepID=A0A9P5Z4D2_9AGAR|nr:hypothetical protein BDN70DRAFT_877317 [Pholiota conissans]